MKGTTVLLTILHLLIISCLSGETGLSNEEFKQLLDNVATGWSTQNTELALSSFDEDAVYMEPPNIQYYRGHKELRPYFDALDNRHQMRFHHIWFDKVTQTGAGEYTFSYGTDTSDVGIAVVEVKNGKIQFWREYQQKGPTDFKDFIDPENKNWEWHIGNYPKPKDSISN